MNFKVSPTLQDAMEDLVQSILMVQLVLLVQLALKDILESRDSMVRLEHPVIQVLPVETVHLEHLTPSQLVRVMPSQVLITMQLSLPTVDTKHYLHLVCTCI